MASSKEMQQTSRPLTHHRSSPSASSSTGIPGRQSHARTSSHGSSLLTGAINANHRVTRRKSVTNSGANINALAAALREEGARSSAVPIAHSSGRRNTLSRASASPAVAGSLPSPPASLPSKSIVETKRALQGSAIDDQDGSADEAGNKMTKIRVRRASDGSPLTKDGKKSNRIEVKCETCGKSYKHTSCLSKHLWEHTPQWSVTSKLLISKHQQVQLLEAASVLVAMNGKETSPTPPGSAKDFASEPESMSPDASGASDQLDRQSSAETTPPPMSEGLGFNGMAYRNKRNSSVSGYSRSYQSAPFAGQGSVPPGNGFGHSRQSSDARPLSSGFNNTGKDDRELAAAVELLSCSFGSNNGSHGTVTLPADAPPVPPVPAQYREHAASLSNAGFINSFPRQQPESFTRGGPQLRRDSEDVRMDEDEDDFDLRSRARSDEDDDGVFGRMEE